MKPSKCVCVHCIVRYDPSIPLRMKPSETFASLVKVNEILQFLWGWNRSGLTFEGCLLYNRSIPLRMKQHKLVFTGDDIQFSAFNSFEDETCTSPDKLVLLAINSFNSFEDETLWCRPCSDPSRVRSPSIPLRMKPYIHSNFSMMGGESFNSFEDETDLLLFSLLCSRG